MIPVVRLFVSLNCAFGNQNTSDIKSVVKALQLRFSDHLISPLDASSKESLQQDIRSLDRLYSACRLQLRFKDARLGDCHRIAAMASVYSIPNQFLLEQLHEIQLRTSKTLEIEKYVKQRQKLGTDFEP